jgi:selenocysteine-specific elongation factor
MDAQVGKVLAALERAAGGARTPGSLAQDLQLPPAEAQLLVEELVAAGEVLRLGRYLVLAGRAKQVREQTAVLLQRLAQAAPWKVGWRKEELLRLLNSDSPRLAEELLADSCRRGDVVDHGGLLALRGHEATLSRDQADALERVEEVLREAGFSPPDWEDVPYLAQVEPRMWKVLEAWLLDTGRAVRVAPRIVYLESILEHGRQRLADLIRAEGPVTASRAGEALQTTRKYLIPLLEYYDHTRFTRRAGDVRHLGEPSLPVEP